MADPSVADPLAAPPVDSAFFSDLPLSFSDNIDDIDFTFDDINLPSDTEDFLNSLPIPTDHPSDLDALFSSLDSSEISAASADVTDFFNVPSPGPASSQGSGDSGNSISKTVKDPSRVSDHPSPEAVSSNGSGNSGNYGFVSGLSKNLTNGVVHQKVKLEEEGNLILKRKKGNGNLENLDFSEMRTSKLRKSNSEGINGISDEDEKRKARLLRNRESAQLSRQRKKHYVEELEDKLRAMHSTIQDLNSRISYIMAENASLKQQANGMPPPPGIYPPPMGYPWATYPPYMVKPQGSQVPLVPIPRMKVQQPAPAPKIKKNESKRNESKSKKVASVSLLGLFFFMVLFGGFVPMVNVKFREIHESVTGRLDYFNYSRPNDRVLTSVNGTDREVVIGNKGQCRNSSEPLVASLFVPRNDKLVKIDGNLIIHSVMASEKAMASTKKSEETGLAVARYNVPSIIPLSGRNRHPNTYRGTSERQRAIGGEKDTLMSSASNGKLQQWFREGLAGPMLSSGMCTEVFQFDVSPAAGAIVPATSVVNASSETQHPKNITSNLTKGRNRRILHSAPIPLHPKSNITERPAEKDNLQGNKSLSSMVVSVLVDPREAGDGDGDGVMGPKSISRIFVVVLIDSVKYVTYSCMLPLIGSSAHLVTN